MILKQLTLLATITSSSLAFAQAPQWVWATSFGTDGWDRAWDMAHDDAGNKYVLGLFNSDTMHIEDIVLTNPGANYDALFVCKYGPSDDAIWAISASGVNDMNNASVRLDENGDLLLSGTFLADSLIFSNGVSLPNPTPGQMRSFRATCTTAGVVLSAVDVTDATSGTGTPLFDADGNSYQTGWFTEPSITLGSETFTNQGMSDAYLVVYDDLGTVLWAIHFGSSGNDGAGIALDQVNGRVIVSGGFSGPSMAVGAETLSNTGQGADGFLASIGFDGVVAWAQDADCGSQDGYGDVEIDGAGNIYLEGYFVWEPITFGTVTIQPGGGPVDWFLAKFDPDGNVLWADGGGGVDADFITSLYLDEYGFAYISGVHTGDTLSFGGISEIYADTRRVFLAKYNPSGTAAWIKAVDGRDYGGSYMDEYGFIYLLTSFSGTIDLDGTTLSTGPDDNYYDIVLAKLDTQSVGIGESSGLGIRAYPNPFASSITLSVPSTGFASVAITDPLGHLVLRFGRSASTSITWDGRTTSGTEVPPGLYLVTVIADGQRYTQRVVKQ